MNNIVEQEVMVVECNVCGKEFDILQEGDYIDGHYVCSCKCSDEYVNFRTGC